MNRIAIRLPRGRFFSLRGKNVEFAIGLIALSLIESQQASAATGDLRFADPQTPETQAAVPNNAEASQELHAAIGKLADLDPSAIQTLTLEQLKALLTPETLASLGLGKGFAKLLDHDPHAAIRKLEAAFRKKVLAAAHGHLDVASADHVGGHDHLRGHDGEHGLDLGIFGGVPLLLPIIAGAAAAGLVVYAATNHKADEFINHPPVAGNGTLTTNQNSSVTFDARTSVTDSDNDPLTITQINGTNITTTTPVTITSNGATIGTVSLGADGKLTFTPVLNYFGTPTFTYTVSDGHGGSATASIALTVNHVNQAPTNTVGGTQETTSGASLLVTGLSVNDIDSTNLTTTVSVTAGKLAFGTVTGGATIVGSGTNQVVLTGTQAQINASLKALTYTAPGGVTGTDVLNIKTTDDQGASTTSQMAVHIGQITASMVSGVLVDGYISGGTIYVDTNGNGKYDDGEPTGTTDATGHYSFANGSGITGTIVASGGINTDTGLPNTATFSAPAGSSVINPLTTMVVAIAAANPGMSVADAQASVLKSLGITADVDLTKYDFLDKTNGTSDAVSLAIQKVATQIATVIAQGVSAGVSAADVTKALGAALSSSTGTLNLTSGDTLKSVLSNSGVSASKIDAVVTATQAANTAIDKATSANDIASTVVAHTDTGTGGTGTGGTGTGGTGTGSTGTGGNTGGGNTGGGNTGGGNTGGGDTPNQAPVAGTDNVAVVKDHAQTFNILANDSDPEGGALTITKINGVNFAFSTPIAITGGTMVVSPTGSVVFTPATGYTGAPTFTYTVADPQGNATVGHVNLTVAAPNTAPVAVADTFTTPADTPATIDVLANDTDADGDTLHVTLINGQPVSTTQSVTVGGGTVKLDAQGKIVFTPDPAFSGTGSGGFHGTPSFDYTISDGKGGTAVGQVSGTVTAVNQAPVLQADTTQTAPLQPVTINVLANDTDGDGDTLTITQIGGQAVTAGGPSVAVPGGSASLDTHGNIVFTPTGASGTSTSFSYTVNDGHGHDVSSTVTVGVSGSVYATDASGLNDILAHPETVTGLGITTLDMAAPTTLTEAQAHTLIDAGLNFADANHITVTAAAHTQLGTTLKSLQDLHVDTVVLGAGQTSVTVVDGDHFSLGSGSVPHFVTVGNATADVTLQVSASNLDTHVAFAGGELAAAGVHTIDFTGGLSEITFAQAQSLTNAHIAVTADSNLQVDVTADQALQIANNTAAVASLDVDHLHVTDGAISLTDTQASALITAGIDFLDGDSVTVTNTGTHLSTSLKGLADLHVDNVLIHGSVSLDAGEGLAALGTATMPHFVGVGGSDPDVTLRIDGGNYVGQDVSAIASHLASFGIDHIGVDNNAPLTFDFAQVSTLNAAHVSFEGAADVTVNVTGNELAHLNPTTLGTLHIDHLHVTDGAATISDHEAALLVDAGVDFATGDTITVANAATHLQTTLKGLTDLHVTDVLLSGAGGSLEHVAAGAALDSFSGTLAHFHSTSGDPDVTLDMFGGNLAAGGDLAVAATSLHNAGIDHLAMADGSHIELTLAQGQELAGANIDFTTQSDVTLDVTGAEAANVNASLLTALHVDHLDVAGNGIASISDAQATALVAAGVDFDTDNTITVNASGTHMSTTMKGLESLHVDTVMINGAIALDAGEGLASSVVSNAMPHFVGVGNTDPDVTLRVHGGDYSTADLNGAVSALHTAGIDHLGVDNGAGLTFTLAQEQGLHNAAITFEQSADVTVNVTTAQLGTLNASQLGADHVDHLHVTDGAANLTDAQASALVGAGVDFVTSDMVNVAATSTHMSTTLKGLHDLHVDTVVLGGNFANFVHGVDALALPALAVEGVSAHLVQATGATFTNVTAAQAYAQAVLDNDPSTATSHTVVSVQVGADTYVFSHEGTGLNGTIDSVVKLSNFTASNLTASDLAGSNHVTAGADLSTFNAGGLPHFTTADGNYSPDVTLDLANGNIGAMGGIDAAANNLHLAGIDHLNVLGSGIATLDDTQANALVHAGLDFVDANTVTMTASGTHSATTLKGLESLHVDTVMVNAGSIHLSGGDDLSTLANSANLPEFVGAGGTDPSVTLHTNAGDYSHGGDFTAIADHLAAAGIDHIGVDGSGTMTFNLAQAQELAHAGIDFDPAGHVALAMSASDLQGFASNPFSVAALHIDTIEIGSTPTSISDVQASNLVAAGLSFATGDHVSVNVTSAGATHLSTTLKGLADLHVEALTVQSGIASLHIDAGDLHGLTAANLPTIPQGLDVTLRVDAADIGDVQRLATSLAAAGIDHIALNQPLSSFSTADQASLTTALNAAHLTLSYEHFSVQDAFGVTSTSTTAAYQDVLHSFEALADANGVGGTVQLADGALSSLAESGLLRAYTAHNLVVDATGSGDHLLTTLKDISETGVDLVKLADQGANHPVYIDLGVAGGGTAASEITQLLHDLTTDGHGTSANSAIFSGAHGVALVVDTATANALGSVNGAMDTLGKLGITEVDVLKQTGDTAPTLNPVQGVEVKVIGQTDPLYDHLHHGS